MPLSPDLRLLADLCSLPTAPFAEGAVIAFVTAFARRHRPIPPASRQRNHR